MIAGEIDRSRSLDDELLGDNVKDYSNQGVFRQGYFTCEPNPAIGTDPDVVKGQGVSSVARRVIYMLNGGGF